jgi:sphinganine-1-phosphate aldolase
MPRWPEHGLAKPQLLAALQKCRAQDRRWPEGRVFAGAYDPGDDVSAIARHVYASYLAEHGPSIDLHPSALAVENDLILLMKELLRAPPGACGSFTSGGTESALLACKAARDLARAARGVQAPELVLSRLAHPAYLQACHLLGIRPVLVPFDPLTFRADIDAMRLAITPHTVLLVANAPGYSHGVLDDVPGIAALAMRHGLPCHVDASLGGMYLSFMRLDRRHVRPFDLSVDGVTSVAVDLHKFGNAPRGAGMLLYRDKSLRRHALFACADTAGYAVVDSGALGTHALAPIAAAWATVHTLGDAGYRTIVRETLAATRHLADAAGALPGLRVLGAPAMCVFALASSQASVFEIADEMRQRGWYLQPQFSAPGTPASLHFGINRKNAQQVDAMLADLKDSVAAAAARPPVDVQALVAWVQQALGDAGGLDGDMLAALWERLGLHEGRSPQRWAAVHALFDALPDGVVNGLLAGYLNGLYE